MEEKKAAILAEIPRLRRYARALLRDRDAADDLVQDSLERALVRMDNWRTGESPRRWLFTIMHHLFIDQVRKVNRRGEAAMLPLDTTEALATPAIQTESVASREIVDALQAISPDRRAALVLVAIEGFSYAEAATILRKGQTLDVAWLTKFLGENGYGRAETVMEPGEFAVRGGLFDLFPPGTTEPLRLDLFGDTLESIRSFDPMSQRSTGSRDEVVLLPVSEVLLTPESIERFRSGYRELFGNVSGEDMLYEAVSAGQRHVGVEHWLPLFHDHMETLLDYCPGAVVTADHEATEAFNARYELIADYYDARQKTGAKGGMTGGADYKPVPPERLYMKPSEWERLLDGHTVAQFSTFDSAPGAVNAIDLGGRRHEGFAQARTAQGVNLFDKVAEHVKAANAAGRRIVVAGYTDGSTTRLQHLLQEHGATTPVLAADFAMVQALPAGVVAIVIWPLEHGFVLDGLEVIGEEDILGDRLSRPAKKRRPSERFIAEASALSDGDLVVHREHGVGRYEGLVTLEIQNARHDCLRLTYEGGDKLFVPVENIDV